MSEDKDYKSLQEAATDFKTHRILILQQRSRNRRRLQFSILSLLILMFLLHVFLAIFMWLRPDLEVMKQIPRFTKVPAVRWLVLSTYLSFLLLAALTLILAMRQKPGKAFLLFSALLVFALFLTPMAYYEHKNQPTFEEACQHGFIDSPSWILGEMFYASVPGVWFVVIAGGMGFGISFQEHPRI